MLLPQLEALTSVPGRLINICFLFIFGCHHCSGHGVGLIKADGQRKRGSLQAEDISQGNHKSADVASNIKSKLSSCRNCQEGTRTARTCGKGTQLLSHYRLARSESGFRESASTKCRHCWALISQQAFKGSVLEGDVGHTHPCLRYSPGVHGTRPVSHGSVSGSAT